MTATGDSPAEALERALGIADGLSGPDPEREALEWGMAPLAGMLDPVRPGADLFARITAGLGLDLPLAGLHVQRKNEGQWRVLSEGVEIKTLWHSHKSRRHAFLIRLHPGAILPEHGHSGDEECLILEGDMVVNDVTFGPGDFQVAFADTAHPNITTRGGCLCLISVTLRAA